VRHFLKRTTRFLTFIVGIIAVFCLTAMPALAEGAEHAEESANNPIELLLPNLGEFVPMLIGFIILVLALAKFGWPNILAMLEKRVETVKNDLAAAEASRLETAELLEKQRADMAEARNEAAQIVAAARAAAEANKAEIEAQATAQAEAMLSRARMVIEAEKNQAMSELRESVADLTLALAGRLIGHDLDDDEHRQIIASYVAQAGSFYDN